MFRRNVGFEGITNGKCGGFFIINEEDEGVLVVRAPIVVGGVLGEVYGGEIAIKGKDNDVLCCFDVATNGAELVIARGE